MRLASVASPGFPSGYVDDSSLTVRVKHALGDDAYKIRT